MRNKLVINIHIYCIIIRNTHTQNNPSVYEGIQLYQYPDQNFGYPQYNKQRTYKNYQNYKWSGQENTNYEDYDDYEEENTCACDKCDELKPSCRDMCPNCDFTRPSVIAPSFVFLPFPYHYPMTPNVTLAPEIQTIETPTSTQTIAVNVVTTTHSTTTKTTINEATYKVLALEASTVSDSLLEEYNEVLKDKPFDVKGKKQYMVTSLRRTKPNWLPKYGIVPISNQFAEKLMLQLRNMKMLHPQKDNIRDVNELT